MHANPPDLILRRWFAGLGGALLVLAASAIVGRAIEFRWMMTAAGIGPPMAFPTAMAFALCGLSLAALAGGRRVAGAAAAGVTLACGAVMVVSYVLASALGWENFFAAALPANTALAYWLRECMAPNTAAGFALLGAALLLIALPRPWPKLVGALAAVLLALGAMALVGFATGLRAAFTWGRYGGMALNTALGLSLGAAAVLVWLVRRPAGPERAAERTFPMFTVGLATLGVLAVIIVVSDSERQEAGRGVQRAIETKAALERFAAAMSRVALDARTYARTGDPDDREAIDFHRDTAQAVLRSLAIAAEGEPQAGRHLAALREGTAEALRRVELQVAAGRAEPETLAAPWRAVADHWSAEQDRLRVERESEMENRGRQLHLTIALGGTFAFALLGVAFGLVRTAQRQLRAANEILELRVAERTSDLQFLADAMPQLVYTARPDGTIAALNRRWREYLGVATEAEALEAVQHCVHPDDLGPVQARWQAMIREGREAGGELRLRRVDGEYRWHLWRTYPQRDDTGRIVRWIGTSTDIHARKIAERELEGRVAERAAALATSEERFRSVTATAVDAIVIADGDDRVLTWNRGAELMFGRRAEEIVGAPLTDVIAERDWEAHRAEMRRLRASDSGLPGRFLELHGRRRGGAEFPLEIALTSWRTEAGTFFGAVMRDVSERRAAMAALRASEQLFQRLFDSAPDAVLLVASDGRIMRVNAGATQLFGWPDGTLAGQSLDVLLPERLRTRHAQHLANFFQVPRTRPMGAGLELAVRRKDGSEMPVDITLSPVVTDEGVQTLAVVRDSTERKRVQESLAQARDAALEASRLKSEFLASVSHEIRTPMNAIIGMTGLLGETRLTAEQQAMLRLVQGGTETLLALVNDILDLTRIEAGKLRLMPEPFVLRRLFDDTLALLTPRVRAKRLVLATKFDLADDACLVGDHGRIRQVLTNLVDNAIKFTDRGDIVVSVTTLAREGDDLALRFAVRDSGAGIPPEMQKKLFQPFVQLGDGVNLGGAGVGLAVSRQLVELMGGKIGCDSAPGSGATFWFQITLPAGKMVAPAQARAQVLVVDDNEDDRVLLEHELRRGGIATSSVADGTAALAWLKERVANGEPLPLVLIDWHLRGMTGLQLAAAIQAEAALARAHLVLISGGPLANPAMATEAGFAEFLLKPVRHVAVQCCLDAAGVARAPVGRTEARKEERTTPARPLRVLLAEDNPANQIVARMLLHKIGAIVDTVPDGEQALEQLKRGPYDALLVDCQMPRLSGYDTTRRIRAGEAAEIDARLPIIAVTAYAMREDRAKCLAAGMNDYVTKPLRLPELCAAFERCGFGPKLRATGAGVASAEPDGEIAVLDPRTIESLRGMPGERGPSLLPEITERFLAEEAAVVPLLERLTAECSPLLPARAHAFAGEAAAVGGFAVRETALALEAAAAAGDRGGAARQFAALCLECGRLRSAVAALEVPAR